MSHMRTQHPNKWRESQNTNSQEGRSKFFMSQVPFFGTLHVLGFAKSQVFRFSINKATVENIFGGMLFHPILPMVSRSSEHYVLSRRPWMTILSMKTAVPTWQKPGL